MCGQTMVCDCGWTHSYANNASSKKKVDSVVLTMILTCSLFVASFVHAVNWDTHFFAIIPLKLKQFSGLAKADDLSKIVEICSLRAKDDCVETAYKKMFELNTRDINVLAQLARVQFNRANLKDVVKTLEVYFSQGGKSADAAYDYARALAELGRYEDALKYFKFVLNSKPKVFQIEVARSYVQTLIKNKKFVQAKSAIEHYRRRSASSAFFMEKEYKAVVAKTMIGGRHVASQSADL